MSLISGALKAIRAGSKALSKGGKALKTGLKTGLKAAGGAMKTVSGKTVAKFAAATGSMGFAGALIIDALNGGNAATDTVRELISSILGVDLENWQVNLLIIALVIVGVLVLAWVVRRRTSGSAKPKASGSKPKADINQWRKG